MRRPDTGGRIIQLPWFGLGISDELGDRLGRNGLIGYEYIGVAADAADRGDVANEVEVEIFIKGRIDGVCRGVSKSKV